MTAIVLTMIVKDEAHVIGRCLGALKPHIDHAVIIDTGSTDNTIEKIKDVLPDATIGHSPFVSFQHNRTELLQKAREAYPDADFHLMMDADDTWVPGPDFKWPELTDDAYTVLHRLGGLEWWRPQLFRAKLPFYYGGVAHESLFCDEPFQMERLEGVRVQCGSDGARRVNEPVKKYERVAARLQKDHDENPSNTRTIFYLAQSYRDCGEKEKALHYYEMRAGMGRWAEEVWYSKYQVASLKEVLDYEMRDVMQSYLDAYLFRPTRAEPMVAAAAYCRRRKQRGLQMLHACAGLMTPKPKKDVLFVEWRCYDWKAWDEFAMACWHHDRLNDALWANYQILCRSEGLEDGPLDRILGNISYCSQPDGELEDLKSVWRSFRGLPAEERNVDGVRSVFTGKGLDKFVAGIVNAVETGGIQP